MFRITVVALLYLALSSLALADEDEHHGHRHGHHRHAPIERVYYQQAPQYAPPPPAHFNSDDRRSHQGLAGGVIGSVVGYELGAGNPIASGLGAAAGSYLGNRMVR